MPACILRYIGTNDVVGFYAFETENDLFYLLDEETDPGDYEYAIIHDGFGIELRDGRGDGIALPIGKDPEGGYLETALNKVRTVYMTGDLVAALLGIDDLAWHRLFQK